MANGESNQTQPQPSSGGSAFGQFPFARTTLGLLQRLGGGLQQERAARQNRREAERQRQQAAQAFATGIGQLKFVEEAPEVLALRSALLGDLAGPQGITQESQRNILSQLRSSTGRQTAGAQRQLRESLAARGLGGSSIAAAGETGLLRQQLSSLAQARQNLALESEERRRQREQQTRGQTLGLVSARSGLRSSIADLIRAGISGGGSFSATTPTDPLFLLPQVAAATAQPIASQLGQIPIRSDRGTGQIGEQGGLGDARQTLQAAAAQPGVRETTQGRLAAALNKLGVQGSQLSGSVSKAGSAIGGAGSRTKKTVSRAAKRVKVG